MLMFLSINSYAQKPSSSPTWWFGISAAGNLNYLSGTTQRLDNAYFVPTAFHKGTSVRPFGSILVEYNPGKTFGGILNVGYDGRGARFDDVIAPCNCPATLNTNLSYITVEPSLRINAGASKFYFFLGPRVAFNLSKNYDYTQLYQADRSGDFSAINKTVFSGQIGAGYDYDISNPNSTTKVVLSPFISFHPYFGQDPRTIESLSITTVRTGLAIKFGKGSKAEPIKANTVIVPMRDVDFTVRAPKMIPEKRKVSETLPLLNYVFFDDGSTKISKRYVLLNQAEASNFKEEQLQEEATVNDNGRSSRQLNIYYNILNIIGDRMRSNPESTISLSGASPKGPEEGKLFAQEIQEYLVSVFGINSSRIETKGSTKPAIPSEQPGGTKELASLREGDRRVDIVSTSPALLFEVGGGMMKPVNFNATQVNPLDSHLILNVDGAEDVLKSWRVKVIDKEGKVQNYGPYSKNQASIPGKTILGTSSEGDYKVIMTGTTKSGTVITKESTAHLIGQNESLEKGYRYSILFNFDKTRTIDSYQSFLQNQVAPLITNGSTVIIHGHTDVIGSEDYNKTLSVERAMGVQRILETTVKNSGKSNVKFETYGFGEELNEAPFNNKFPEERFYNRTVIIDIIPVK